MLVWPFGLFLTVCWPQSLHFFIGLGALISPLVADPFLTDNSCTLETNRTPNFHHVQNNTSKHEAAGLDQISPYGVPIDVEAIGSVSYAFWIMALINVSPSAGLCRMKGSVFHTLRVCRCKCVSVFFSQGKLQEPVY